MFRGVSFRRLGKLALRPSGSEFGKKFLPRFLLRSQTRQLSINYQSWANFTTTPVAQTSNNTILATNPSVEEGLRKLDTAEWKQVLQILADLSAQFPEKISLEQLEPVYEKVEQRFLQDSKDALKVPSVVELGYAFGKLVLGSDAFWNKLMQRFSALLASSGLNIYEISRFLFGATNKISLEPSIFDDLESNIAQSNETLTPEILGFLLPAIAKIYASNQQQGLFQQIHSNIQQNADNAHPPSIQDLPLWSRLIDTTMEQIPQMDATDIICVLDSFIFAQYKDEGIWTPIEQRFDQLKSQLTITEYANFAYYFGSLQRGSSEFWANIEQLLTEEVSDLSPHLLKSFILGLARAEEGSLKLWHLLESRVLKSNLSADELVAVVESFTAHSLASLELWNHLEKQIVERISEFNYSELTEVVRGFGKAQSGFQSFWTALESRILEGEQVSEDLELILYLELKIWNKLTPELARHFRSVAETGDKIFEGMEEENQRLNSEQ